MTNPRNRLPGRRRSETCEFTHEGLHFTVSTGFYPSGAIGEVFLSSNKPGSPIEAIARDGAILISLCLQHGCDVGTIRHALTKGHDGSPATIIGAALSALAVLL